MERIQSEGVAEYRGGMTVKIVIDHLVEIGALPDVRMESGERDHQAIVEGLLTALRPSVLRFARVMGRRG